MAPRSLRDELLSAGPRRGGRRRGRPLKWIIGAAVVALLALLLIALLGNGADDPGADDPGSTSAEAEVASDPAETPQDQPADDGSAPDDGSGGSGDAAEGASASEGPQAERSADVRRSLDSLPVVSGRSSSEYERELFGQAWYDVDGNGCDTRNDVLGRDLRDIVFKDGTGDCKVLEGTLDDWYSGSTVRFISGTDTSRLVQVDHVVPLSWAWHHGADAWDEDRRREFANDPLNLVATTDEMNQAKSDQGPSEWLPGDDAAQCRYAQRFTGVLSAYGLGIDLRDRAMMRGILEECAGGDAFGAFADLGD